MTALVRVEAVARRYTVFRRGGMFGRRAILHAVDGVSFTLERGRTLALVGESGCGKSTTARLVLGLESADAGHVSFDGESMPRRGSPEWRRMRRHMQMVYQDPLAVLDRRQSALALVREPLDIFALGPKSGRDETARGLLDEVGLSGSLQTRYPHELSGGQRQRVVLARALATRPALLVCDEPISALDVSIQAQVINLLADLQERHGLTMLFISHDLRVVQQVADSVAVMYLGRIVEQGPPAVLFARAAHPYTQALISAIPSHRPRTGAAPILLEGDPPNPIDRVQGCPFAPRCWKADDRCRVEAPPMRSLDDTQQVACFNSES